MAKKHLRGFKIFLIILCGSLLSTASYFTIDAMVENHRVKQLLHEFLSQKIIECEYAKNFDMNFCRMEKKKATPSFHPYDNDLYTGSRGDIIVSLENEMFFPVKPFMDFYAGGHAGLIERDDTIIEIAGLAPKKEDNVVYFGYNYWLRDTELREEYVGLTVKNITPAQLEKVMNKAYSFLGQYYNYTFVFNTKKTRYCTDIISKAYTAIDIQLDEDRFITTAQDLIISKYTEIFFYKEINKTIKDPETNELLGSHNIYYLDDGIDWNFDEYYF